ncbi:MAG: 4'-phosphopantetheinyl transferase superfamily protein [Mucilaginibacter polytrichastri]|nr:4'-phosphopantetheinyl transferase superfamily protein [Mucilaginibacter polytrichastri]
MALAWHHSVNPNTEIALWKIEEEAEDLYGRLRLRDSEKAHLEKLKSSKRHLHWLGTRVLLRELIGTREYINCVSDKNGKPYLVDLPYSISFSHSFDYAGVMISREQECGLDIELIKDKVVRIAGKFLQPEEQAFIDRNHETEHISACWCAKEAVYKCYGKREISFLNHIFLQTFPYRSEGGQMNIRIENDHILNYYEGHYLSFDGYMIGYVTDNEF